MAHLGIKGGGGTRKEAPTRERREKCRHPFAHMKLVIDSFSRRRWTGAKCHGL